MLLSKILIDPNHSANDSHPHIHYQQHPQYALSSTGTGYGGGGTLSSKKSFDNFAFNAIETKNEFNASAFGLHVEPSLTDTGIGYNSYVGHSEYTHFVSVSYSTTLSDTIKE